MAGRDHVNNSRNGIAASFGFGLDSATRAYLNLLYVKQDNIPDGYVPTVGIDHWTPQPGLENLVGNPVDSENFYGTKQDHDDVTAKMATFRLEHDFSDQVKLTNVLRWGETIAPARAVPHLALRTHRRGTRSARVVWDRWSDWRG